jgi:transcriptional regulator
MHVPSADRPISDEEWRSFIERQGFGHLVAQGPDGDVPVVTPTQFVLDGDDVLAHAAAPNPILGALERQRRGLLSVAGDWAFIPSSWKAIGDEDPTRGIPTTYYAAVQLSGPIDVVFEPDAVAALLRRQLARLQPDVEIVDPAVGHAAKLAGIRGIVLHVEHVVAKFKFGGNVDEAHRLGVIERLESRGAPGDDAALVHARRRIGTDAPGPSAFRRD